jgi:hypothetical protein
MSRIIWNWDRAGFDKRESWDERPGIPMKQA